MKENKIEIKVALDESNIPEKITWQSLQPQTQNAELKEAKAMLLSFWDGEDKTALRLDLWAKTMRIDEMADFFFQTFFTMADTYKKAVQNSELDKEIRKFAKHFYEQFIAEQSKK